MRFGAAVDGGVLHALSPIAAGLLCFCPPLFFLPLSSRHRLSLRAGCLYLQADTHSLVCAPPQINNTLQGVAASVAGTVARIFAEVAAAAAKARTRARAAADAAVNVSSEARGACNAAGIEAGGGGEG